MQLNLQAASGHNFVFSGNFPPDFEGSVLPGSLVLTANDPELGTIVQQELSNTHYTIRLYRFNFIEPVHLSVFQPGSFLTSILAVKNNLEYSIEGLDDLTLKHGQFALLHSGSRPGTLYFRNTRPYEFLEVSWAKDWLKKLVNQFHFLQSLFAPANIDKSYYLAPHPKPAGIMALDKVQKILNSPFDDATSRLLFESHTWEYLILILVESAKASSKTPNVTDRDRQILKILREEVSTNFRKKYTIAELCRRANMSATKFKNAFKEIFGIPLGQLTMKSKMERALELLKENQLSVKEISEKLNYKKSNSFSKQFRKHFGYWPTDVHKKE